MSKKINAYKTENDVSSVNLDVYDAAIEILPANDKILTVEFLNCAKVQAANNDNALYVKQSKRAFPSVFAKAKITIRIPEHLVPEISVIGNRVNVNAEGGIYASWDVFAESGSITLEETALESLEIKGGAVSLFTKNLTVKNSVITNVKSGDAAFDNCFATHMDCRTGRGNIGVSNLICRDSTFEAGEGNITATVKGDESVYDVIVTAREGICNRESKNIEGEIGSFKAFAAKGNIHVDFIDDKSGELVERQPEDSAAATTLADEEVTE